MSEPSEGTPAAEPGAAYRVLARKYRPARFADLIGQDALVRTLSNAIAGGRLAHAYVLTGVRGVGKTTTARILARALNCVGADGPTAEPCGLCEHCTAIGEDRHVDVIEMDAASRTGIADVRELIEGVHYRPVSARNKVYIIDEVHMLSPQAFNGLLKTLEEPPEHVVFIFATTEIRKVPVTVLSRCQRFDLRRVEEAVLAGHFAAIAEKEGVALAPEALAMIARAADGSVRDGLSLLDQAIALAEGAVDAAHVKDMLGLADRIRIFDLFEAVVGGRIAAALDLLGEMHGAGADPLVVLQDLLELTHFLTRLRVTPETAADPGVPEAERVRGRALAENLGLAALTRCWQMLLKGLGEARQAPAPLQAAEMVLIRLAYASDLPSPGELVRRLEGSAAAAPVPTPAASPTPSAGPRALAAEPQPAAPGAALAPCPESFLELVALARDRKEGILAGQLEQEVHLVRFEPGIIEFRPGERAPQDLAGRLGRLLQDWTGRRWVVGVSSEAGGATLREQRAAAETERLAAAEGDPLVQAALQRFPGARILDVRAAGAPSAGMEREDER